jgi:PAS domain-containing protein
LREALLAAKMGIWEWSEATDNVTWVDNLYRIAGQDLNVTDAPSEIYARALVPESWERLKVEAETAFITGTSFELDLELVRPDGSRRFLIARGKPLRDADGHITKLRGTVQDITERKKAEEELRRSKEEGQSVMASIPDFLWSADIDGQGRVTHRYYSPVVEKITVRPNTTCRVRRAGSIRFILMTGSGSRKLLRPSAPPKCLSSPRNTGLSFPMEIFVGFMTACRCGGRKGESALMAW